MRWEWVAQTERETEERRTSRREPRTTWPGATWRTQNSRSCDVKGSHPNGEGDDESTAGSKGEVEEGEQIRSLMQERVDEG